jgi:hypothetical protein
MSSNPVRKVMAVVITMVFAFVMGAVIAPVSFLLSFTDPVLGRAWDEWAKLQVFRVYQALAFPARPREHTPG